jgi:hypothetical protein
VSRYCWNLTARPSRIVQTWDLCVAFLSLPVKSEAVVAESHNSLAVVALKDLVRVKDEFVEARR